MSYVSEYSVDECLKECFIGCRRGMDGLRGSTFGEE